MGLPFSAFNKFGLPGLSSVTSGQVYDRHFKGMPTGNFADFHVAYVEFCKYFNTVMPGQDFNTPSLERIRTFYEDEWKSLEEDERGISSLSSWRTTLARPKLTTASLSWPAWLRQRLPSSPRRAARASHRSRSSSCT